MHRRVNLVSDAEADMRIRVVLSEPAFAACNKLVPMIYGLHTLFVCAFSVVVVLPLLLYAVIVLYVCICS